MQLIFILGEDIFILMKLNLPVMQTSGLDKVSTPAAGLCGGHGYL